MSSMVSRVVLVTFCMFIQLGGSTSNAQDVGVKPAYRIVTADGTASFPFEWNRGHIMVEVDVNGKKLRLTLDNGVLWDSLLLYGGPRIDALGLEYSGQRQLGKEGDANATKIDLASGITVRLPGVELTNQLAAVTHADSRYGTMFSGEDGIISGSLFNHFVVQIDFEKMLITLIEPGKFEYKGKGQAQFMSPFGRGTYTLPCRLHLQDGSSIVVHPVLDLGGIQPLLLFLSKRKDIAVPADATPARLALTWDGFIGRVEKLQIGTYSLKNVVTGYTEAVGKLGKDCEGLLGPQVFARFTTTFDYRNKTVYLEPNSHFDDEFEVPALDLPPGK